MEGSVPRAAMAWRRAHLPGIGGRRPCFRSIYPASGSTTQNKPKKVPIQWGLILQDVLSTLGARDAVYTHEKSDSMVQVNVQFRVPVDKSRTMFKDVEAHGIRCPEPCLAESTAAIAALQEFQRAPFYGRIIDVSCLRCEEMETSCNRFLVKAGEVYRGLKLLLSDYEDSMEKAEGCYKSLYEDVVEFDRRGYDRVYGDILMGIAHRIYELNKENYVKFKQLSVDSKEIKGAEWDVRSRSEHHFRDRSHDMLKKRGGESSSEIKICMKIVLREMISSLGWEKPVYEVTGAGTNLFVCEIILTPEPGYLGSDKKTVSIVGAEGASESDSVESACQSAVLFLDTRMTIHVCDVNYLKRSHAEVYLSEAREVASRAISMGEKVLAEWEKMVDELHACEEYCWTIVMEHPEKEPWNQVYNLKYECAHLMRAKDRHSWLSSWTDQEVDL